MKRKPTVRTLPPTALGTIDMGSPLQDKQFKSSSIDTPPAKPAGWTDRDMEQYERDQYERSDSDRYTDEHD